MDTRIQSAIRASLAFDWKKAIEINNLILEDNPKDINTLNRLAYAFIQLGEIEKAKKTYQKIFSLDRYNHIAQKNLDKISSLPDTIKVKEKRTGEICPLSPSLFIEEPGKTKTLSLINLAPCTVISRLNVGDTLDLFPKKYSVEVRSPDNIYIGALPDDVSFRLIRLIKAGNQYQVSVKNVTKNSLTIFIRELNRGKRFAHLPSFHFPILSSLSTGEKEQKTNSSHVDSGEEKISQTDSEV